MPEVTFSPINQCTLDDPTDGAQPSSAPGAPSGGAGALPGASSTSCPALSGAGGDGGDACADALVRRFSSEGGAPYIEEPDRDASPSCVHDALDALRTCSPLLLAATQPRAYVAAQAVQCAASVATLLGCLAGKDDAVR
jgi:hypothetical protein